MENMEKIEQIIQDAMNRKASDIHVTPGCPMMYRIDGKLVIATGETLEISEVEELAKQLLAKEQEQLLKEKGEVGFTCSLGELCRIRVNIYGQLGGYAISIRIIPFTIAAPEELGIPLAVREMMQKKKGLLLITGSAGSGKTTTIASLIQFLAENEAKHIITVEKAVEYVLPCHKSLINQREIGTDTVSYTSAVEAALRQDPDVIMLDELVDAETIELAMRAAESGRLIIATLYTEHAEEAIEQIINVFPSSRQQQIRIQLSHILLGIASQQLLPKLDDNGRIAVFEVMQADDEIKELIRKEKLAQMKSVMINAKQEGMQTMDDAIYSLYMQSAISAETAIRHAEDNNGMKEKVILF